MVLFTIDIEADSEIREYDEVNIGDIKVVGVERVTRTLNIIAPAQEMAEFTVTKAMGLTNPRIVKIVPGIKVDAILNWTTSWTSPKLELYRMQRPVKNDVPGKV